jgi:hypothetical protein
MMSAVHRLCAAAFLSLLFLFSQAQPLPDPPVNKDPKPYQLLTSGKQLTIKSTRGIRQVMLWTVNGNRVVEQRAVNNNSYTINIPVNHKTFFLMVGLNDGKVYTEKIGVRD